MLGKLFKYEFQGTYKLMLTIYGVLLGVTAYGSIILSTPAMQYGGVDDNPVMKLLLSTFILLYVLSAFALFIVTYLYMFLRFYKTMYSDQGYLTHTLPVSPLAVFNVKLVTSLVWVLGSLALFIFSVFLLLLGASRGMLLAKIYSVDFADFAVLNSFFHEIFGMSFVGFILYLAGSMIFSALSFLLMVFASISIGQLFNQHKIAAAIVTGLVLNFAQQMLGTIVLIITGGVTYAADPYFMGRFSTVADMLFSPPVIAGMLLSLAITVSFYIACAIIVKSHINLD